MKNIIKCFAATAKKLSSYLDASAVFGNISQSTHAGSVTMTAGASIDGANLIVKNGTNAGEILVAGPSDKPVGVCLDEGETGDVLAVALPGCAESTFMCVASGSVSLGDDVYTAAGGKISSTPANGAYKIGVALCSASTGGIVEVDPRGFGERAYGVLLCGVHSWNTSTTASEMSAAGILATDIVVASIQSGAGSAKTVSAVAADDKINFSLDAAGTSGTTKIAYIIIRKN